jgi:aryl-alcohol dehydrogenase-like predicted oxidoreductase
MKYRKLGRNGPEVSAIGFGCMSIGIADVYTSSIHNDEDAIKLLHRSMELGVTFLDTADVYGVGRSEQVIGRFLKDNPDLTVATKMGRRVEQLAEHYALDNFRAWTDRSRRNLGVDTLDLVQLHCPPSAVIDADATYDALDTLVDEGAIAAYGVSVETCAQALSAIARPHVASIQIILNAFRLKPLDAVLPAAADAGVAIIARVPLASGLLSGRYDADTTFAADDHRTYNRHGEAFDVGETFSGVDYEAGVRAAQEFSALVRELGVTPAQAALAWVVQQPGVTTVIPGARNAEQARANAAAGLAAPLPDDVLVAVAGIYDRYFREAVHGRW